jgi:hypothetical protein
MPRLAYIENRASDSVDTMISGKSVFTVTSRDYRTVHAYMMKII